MRTFALKNGDLMLSGDRYSMVAGIARVQQSLGLALREPYQADRFHPSWGSVLPEWIGRSIDPGIQGEIRAEITRVVRAFIVTQAEFVRRRTNEGRKPPLSAEEMIADISSITIQQNEDEIIVKVVLRTLGTRTLSIITSPEGRV